MAEQGVGDAILSLHRENVEQRAAIERLRETIRAICPHTTERRALVGDWTALDVAPFMGTQGIAMKCSTCERLRVMTDDEARAAAESNTWGYSIIGHKAACAQPEAK